MSATTLGSGSSGAGDPPAAPEETSQPGQPGRGGSRIDQGTVLRTDIQGLRAVAVSLS